MVLRHRLAIYSETDAHNCELVRMERKHKSQWVHVIFYLKQTVCQKGEQREKENRLKSIKFGDGVAFAYGVIEEGVTVYGLPLLPPPFR